MTLKIRKSVQKHYPVQIWTTSVNEAAKQNPESLKGPRGLSITYNIQLTSQYSCSYTAHSIPVSGLA
jgi:hypothetical protein